MKFNKLFLTILAVAGLCGSAWAQRGFDSFNTPKTLVVCNAQNFVNGTGIVTNGPYDIRVLDGLASVDVFAVTNTGATGGTMTLTIQSSANSSNNFANVTGLAFINSMTSISYTNASNTNSWATDVFLVPGTFSTYNPAVNLAAGTILNPPAYTNSGALTLPNGYSKIGWSVDDSSRYVQFIWTPGGTSTNWTVGAELTGINPVTLK